MTALIKWAGLWVNLLFFLPDQFINCWKKIVVGCHNKWIWKAGIPLKIKVFMWQAFQDAVITRDNMRKRKWPGSPLCSFCCAVETTNHLFFHCSVAKIAWGAMRKVLGTSFCPKNFWQAFVWFYSFLSEKFYMFGMAAVCWAIWILRNKMTFEKYVLQNPAEVVFMVCYFLMHWTGLHKEEDKKMLESGVKRLMETAAGLASGASA
jgi:hypothetical protein